MAEVEQRRPPGWRCRHLHPFLVEFGSEGERARSLPGLWDDGSIATGPWSGFTSAPKIVGEIRRYLATAGV